MGERIPFDYFLLDERHEGFVDGKRETLFSPWRALASRYLFVLTIYAWLPLSLINMGIWNLYYEYVAPWATVNASIYEIYKVETKDSLSYWYDYSFKGPDGRNYAGRIVRKNSWAFAKGATVPVKYSLAKPGYSRYTEDPYGGIAADWVVVLVGLALFAVIPFGLYWHFARAKVLLSRDVTRKGYPVPGKFLQGQYFVTKWYGHGVRVQYTIDLPDQKRTPLELQPIYTAAIPKAFFSAASFPPAGTPIAIWYVPERKLQFLL